MSSPRPAGGPFVVMTGKATPMQIETTPGTEARAKAPLRSVPPDTAEILRRLTIARKALADVRERIKRALDALALIRDERDQKIVARQLKFLGAQAVYAERSVALYEARAANIRFDAGLCRPVSG